VLDTTIKGLETWSLTKAELKAVFASVERGANILYAVGDLYTARQTDTRWDLTGEYAYKLWDEGKAHLKQERKGPHRYEYRVEKR
jgi:hypothetical protein